MGQTGSVTTESEPLFATEQSERFTSRWQEIQTSFVDQPRDAVAEADSLVADLMQRLAASFSQERERLEAQWDVATTSPPKTSASPSPATAPSSTGSSPPSHHTTSAGEAHTSPAPRRASPLSLRRRVESVFWL
jgi:hypothetical protein